LEKSCAKLQPIAVAERPSVGHLKATRQVIVVPKDLFGPAPAKLNTENDAEIIYYPTYLC
jgi:hypothetical protein